MPIAIIRTEADFLPQELAEFRADQARIHAAILRKKDERETQARQVEEDAANQERVWRDRDAMLAQIAADRTTITNQTERIATLEEAVIEILKKEVDAPIASPTASRERRARLSRILRNYKP